MNDHTYNLRSWSLGLIVLVAAILGGLVVLGGEWAVDELTEPTTIEGRSEQGIAQEEPDLMEAIHDAAVAAVEVEGGKFKGEELEIDKIWLTADNPHITAYRVILQAKS
jgi:hypothetical protein